MSESGDIKPAVIKPGKSTFSMPGNVTWIRNVGDGILIADKANNALQKFTYNADNGNLEVLRVFKFQNLGQNHHV